MENRTKQEEIKNKIEETVIIKKSEKERKSEIRF